MATKNPNSVNSTSCPICSASPNYPCKMRSGREKRTIHRARVEKHDRITRELVRVGILKEGE